jgi:hypothetical protein
VGNNNAGGRKGDAKGISKASKRISATVRTA